MIIKNLSKPFTFNELRAGILVYLCEEYTKLIEPSQVGLFTKKSLSEIPSSINTNGPFKVIITTITNEKDSNTFNYFSDAIRFGNLTADGTEAHIFDKDNKKVGYVDAT